jgi:hypothetical protein
MEIALQSRRRMEMTHEYIRTIQVFSYLRDKLLIKSHEVCYLKVRYQPPLQVFAFHSGDRLSRITSVVFLIPNSNHLLLNFRERNMEEYITRIGHT